MLTRAEWCRIKAGECTALAAVTGREVALELRQLASQWLQMTDDVELLDRLKPDWMPFDQRWLH